jgi:hypothetical protein
MKNLKLTSILFAVALLLTSFLTGCEKDGSSSDSKSIEGLLYYFTDEENQEIKVVDIDASSPFRRSFILSDDYTLEDIAQDRDYLVLKIYRPSSVSTLASKKGHLIKSKVFENNWLFVANNPFLGLTGTTDDDWFEASEFPNEATGFTFHKTGEINGEDVYAIESVAYPGRYFSHSGHPIQGTNLLYLEEYDEPDNAPKFRLYRTESTFLEGNPSVPVDAQFAW